MAGILGKAGLQFVSRGVARFEYVQLLQEQTARKERERGDSIGGGNSREGHDVDAIGVAFQHWRRRLDREKRFSAPRLCRARRAPRLSAKLAPAFYQPNRTFLRARLTQAVGYER
jgi:hypothetical protein